MSDLQLEVANKEVKQTTLIGSPGDLGPKKIKDFTGAHVLECIPDSALLNSSAPGNNFGGIYGRGVGAGIGVRGESTSGAGIKGEGDPGVLGSCRVRQGREQAQLGHLAGVKGESIDGPGVFGDGHVGGQFRGSSAQLALVPGPTAGKPASGRHATGEIYMDSEASLFVCIAGGFPGTWVRVVTA
jgi:hypothetical protein